MKVRVPRGAALRDVLFEKGVEFPCGGHGRCRACRVRVIEGSCAANDESILSAGETAAGWRLACRATAETDLTVEVAQWEHAILADHTPFAFIPRDGTGIAVDLGTTTLVAQQLDLRTGEVLGVRTALNPQAAWGADVMSRVQMALDPGGARKLREAIHAAIAGLTRGWNGRTVIVGNTVMHHIYCGIDIAPLAACPFEPVRDGLERVDGAEFLPCLGGFVGSDILAGVLATRMHESAEVIALVDLGTNGEIIAGNRERMVCASTAAGPAFEAGRISMGMRAAPGAIAEVRVEHGALRCHVLGNAPPRGICGSGLVDAVAAGLDTGAVLPNGRLALGKRMMLAAPVAVTQADIRELQLAKAATAAGIRIVLRRLGVAEPARLYLAGAFGNYVNRASARRIGLIDFPEDRVEPAGNTALLGAKLALFHDFDFGAIRTRVEHIPLASDPAFEDEYVGAMRF